jgi:hypothetical protein
VRRASGGRDGCRQAGALTATRREPSATGGRWAAINVTAPSPTRTQDDVIFNEPGRRTRHTRGDGGDSCAGGSAERTPAHVKCRSAVVRSAVFVPNWDCKSG